MLTLRLARAGTKKRPVYHLVACDSRARRDGRFIENLGYYIPGRNVLVLKNDRVEHWLKVGATPSETAGHLIKKSKLHGNIQPVAKPKYTPPPKAVVVEAPKAPENAVEKTE
jgi:small subunit ribosomal protein S16